MTFHQFLIKSCVSLLLLYFLSTRVCQAIMCDEPPTIANADADFRGLKEPFLNGTMISYSCHSGYILTSNVSAFAICVVNDNTSHHWHYEPFSCASSCENPPAIPHADFNFENRNPPFSSGETVKYICRPGYTTESGFSRGEIICGPNNDNSSWIMPLEACRPKSCGYPGDIENAVRRGSLYTFPYNVTYICNEGFQVKGTATIYCTASGNWRPNIPSCDAVICPLLSHPINGIVKSERQYGAKALYECNPEFGLKGNTQRLCQSDATWSGSAPTCVEITCLDPGPIPNGRAIPKKDKYKVGDVVIYACTDESHKFTSRCSDNGQWSVEPPHCKGESTTISPNKIVTEINGNVSKENCDNPGEIRNGKQQFITKANGNSITQVITYSCEEGYELRGLGTLVCSPDGKWDMEKLPICVKRIPVSTIVAIVISIIVVILLGVGGFLYYQWRRRKLQDFGKNSKALTTDATDLEEIARLEKAKKPVPVTVL